VTPQMEAASYVIVSLFRRDKSGLKDTSYFREDWGVNLFRMGSTRFEVDISHKSLAIDIKKSSQMVSPQESIKVDLRVKKNNSNEAHKSELTVMVVDDGILSLSGYRPPLLVDTFYKAKNMISVVVDDNRSYDFFPFVDFKKEELIDKKDRSVDIRKEFKSTIYYNGNLVTDDGGRASFSFKVPDNLTKWRIMVVAVGKDSLFGYKEDSVVVSLPIAIREVLPNFVRYGDIFEGGCLVTNSTKEEGKIYLESEIAKGKSLEIYGKNRMEMNIKKGETKSSLFKVKAQGEGESILRFKAFFESEKGNKYSDGLERKIKVEGLKPTERVYVVGVGNNNIVQKMIVPENSRKDVGGIDIELSNTILSSLQEGIKYTIEYPYECLEQRLSRMVVILNLLPLCEKYGFNYLRSKDEIDTLIRENLKEIIKLQSSLGGFKIWKESKSEDKFLSSEMGYLFRLCEERGYTIPLQVKKDLENFLRQQIVYDKKEKRILESNLFILTGIGELRELKKEELKELKRIFNKRDIISLYSRIKLASLLNKFSLNEEKEIVIKEILREIKEENDIAYFPYENKVRMIEKDTLVEEDFYWLYNWLYGYCEEIEILMLLLEKGGDEDCEITYKLVRYILSNIDKEGKWKNTYLTGKILNALMLYSQKREIDNGKCELKIFVNNKEKGEYSFTNRKEYKPLKIFIPLRELYVGENEVRIENIENEKRDFYYTIGFSNRLEKIPRRIREEGFEIIRRVRIGDKVVVEYGDKATKDTLVLKKGEEIEVEIEYNLGETKNVVLDEPFAGCFEFINSNLSYRRDREEIHLDNNSFYPFTSRKVREDRIALFGEEKKYYGGKYRYCVRAISRGVFLWPYTSAFEMYNPSKIGTSTEGFVKVE
ncbi:MAG: hypothetical protein N2053_08005, partial [Chitinispirillaceae bacterium]|nr:hypothetical protein [Chitinispirillaceae bacterium]